jgi:phosphatidate phosphatase PAH1
VTAYIYLLHRFTDSALLRLCPGSLPCRVPAHCRASGAADLTAYIYLLRWDTRLVVSDVDGTITRSDLLGHVLPTLGVDWSHPGITQLFHNIDSNGYQIMFLSSR